MTGQRGRVAIVTGAASGIGAALAAQLGEAGAVVVAADRSFSGHETYPAAVTTAVLDTTDAAAVSELFEKRLPTTAGSITSSTTPASSPQVTPPR